MRLNSFFDGKLAVSRGFSNFLVFQYFRSKHFLPFYTELNNFFIANTEKNGAVSSKKLKMFKEPLFGSSVFQPTLSPFTQIVFFQNFYSASQLFSIFSKHKKAALPLFFYVSGVVVFPSNFSSVQLFSSPLFFLRSFYFFRFFLISKFFYFFKFFPLSLFYFKNFNSKIN